MPASSLPLKTILAILLLFSLASGQNVDFNFDVRPLLSDRCFVCHGPDEEHREAELRLDLASAVEVESQSGNVDRVITPGRPDESELWLRIATDDPDMQMPPPDSNLSLTAAERETIRRWIEGGAEYKKHWSFTPLYSAKPTRDGAELTGPAAIDHFIEQRLSKLGWKIGPETTRPQLLRRLSFDLTGLPPTTDELKRFVADESETAIANAIERLLDSPRYGERMASIWLDLARYSDTYGYQVDRDRFVWPWRDWVVRAFNDNMPYDQFVTEQLAGDLLPDPDENQILATTFNRLHPQKVEGGSVPEEFRIEYVADRTQTFATSMLGVTLECARCHDHKYDPLSQKEYYQLTAFFDNIDEAGLYSYFTPSIPTPTLMMGQQAKREETRKLEDAVQAAQTALAEAIANVSFGEGAPKLPEPIESLDFNEFKPNGRNELVEGVGGNAVKLSGDDAVKLKQGNFHRYDPFSVSLWLKMPDRRERAVVFHRSRAWTDAGSRGYQLLIEEGKLSASLIHFWPGNAIRVVSDIEFPLNEWHQVTVTWDGSSRASGLSLYLDGKRLDVTIVRDNLYKQITGGGHDHIAIGQRFRDLGLRDGMVDEFHIYDRELLAAEVELAFDPDAELDKEGLREIAVANDATVKARLRDLQSARKALCDQGEKLKEIMVMQEMETRRETFILGRGAYDNRTQPVKPDTPAVLPPMDESLPRNRLGLAQWLTDPEHPLTSRVAVNRVWQMLFGTGLVRTPEDFGSQGELPTHPELLDWLARDFVKHNWDLKRLITQIVQSRTYRQSSQATSEQRELDPENRLYARAPSYRWPAEMLRDQALSTGGLLVEKQGGPPVKPYDLEVSFKPMKPDDGEGLYRRSLYTFWKRTGPAPVMMALDAAKRDVCRVKRSRTASPLQTLVLMNSPQFVEASRALAERALEKHAKAEARIRWMFASLTARQPTEEEIEVLLELYRARLDLLSDKEIGTYLSVGKRAANEKADKRELAALTVVANTLFGLDECMMKR